MPFASRDKEHRLVLASASPRRRELLERAGFSFTVSPLEISEFLNENLSLSERIQDLAERKAQAWLDFAKPPEKQGILVLAADTVVALGDQILGKPKDQNENLSYLRRLSGREHVVITAVCLVEAETGDRAVGHGLSRIQFRTLREDEMIDYIATGNGLDKAGGYGIQSSAGKFVERLEGEFDNVMGLPVSLVERLLKEKNWRIGRSKESTP